jgi:hypothetical protein
MGNVGGFQGTGGPGQSAGTSGSSSSGNAQLQQAFNSALQQAQQTLSISTTGQANLNALRSRPT